MNFIIQLEYVIKSNYFLNFKQKFLSDQLQLFRGPEGTPKKTIKFCSLILTWSIYQTKKSSSFNGILLTLNKKHLTFMIRAIIAPPPCLIRVYIQTKRLA